MKILVGLGNPGEEYANTRHNIGFRIMDLLAENSGAANWRNAFRGMVTETQGDDERVILLKPMTYMNISGESLGELLDSMKDVEPSIQDILVITDDVSLPLGRLRFRAEGSCGGHNGLASIEAALATDGYPRFRIGVGMPEGESGEGLIDHVLGGFAPAEEELLAEIIPVAARAAREWTEKDTGWCQSNYNGWRPENRKNNNDLSEGRLTEE